MSSSTPSLRLRRPLVACLAAAAALGGYGCAAAVGGSGPAAVSAADASRLEGPFAAAGQRLVVQIDQPIDTLHSVRNGAFTAHLVAPIVATDGTLIAPAGAVVHGLVRSLGSIESPHVRLEFDSIDTIDGPARLPAKVRQAQYRTYPGPLIAGVPAYGPYTGWTGGPGYIGPGGDWRADGGFGYYGGYAPFNPREVHLPAGARLELELTRPLVPPGTVVHRR